jgi:hypothetical protein
MDAGGVEALLPLAPFTGTAAGALRMTSQPRHRNLPTAPTKKNG